MAAPTRLKITNIHGAYRCMCVVRGEIVSAEKKGGHRPRFARLAVRKPMHAWFVYPLCQ